MVNVMPASMPSTAYLFHSLMQPVCQAALWAASYLQIGSLRMLGMLTSAGGIEHSSIRKDPVYR